MRADCQEGVKEGDTALLGPVHIQEPIISKMGPTVDHSQV